MDMCGVASHNVTHDVTGSAVAPKASRDGACERLNPTHTTLLDLGGTGVRDDSSNMCIRKLDLAALTRAELGASS